MEQFRHLTVATGLITLVPLPPPTLHFLRVHVRLRVTISRAWNRGVGCANDPKQYFARVTTAIVADRMLPNTAIP